MCVLVFANSLVIQCLGFNWKSSGLLLPLRSCSAAGACNRQQIQTSWKQVAGAEQSLWIQKDSYSWGTGSLLCVWAEAVDCYYFKLLHVSALFLLVLMGTLEAVWWEKCYFHKTSCTNLSNNCALTSNTTGRRTWAVAPVDCSPVTPLVHLDFQSLASINIQVCMWGPVDFMINQSLR